MPTTDLDLHLADAAYRKVYAEEALIAETMEQLSGWMADHDITRAELARRMGTSPSNITQMLSGRNVSLRTLASAAFAMGAVVRGIQLAPEHEALVESDLSEDPARCTPPALTVYPGGRRWASARPHQIYLPPTDTRPTGIPRRAGRGA